MAAKVHFFSETNKKNSKKITNSFKKMCIKLAYLYRKYYLCKRNRKNQPYENNQLSSSIPIYPMDNSISFDYHTRRNRCDSLSMATTATTSFVVRPHSARRSPTQLYGAHPTQINSNNRRYQHPPSRMENQYSCR